MEFVEAMLIDKRGLLDELVKENRDEMQSMPKKPLYV